MRAIRKVQPPGNVDSGLRKRVELSGQSYRIDHDARTDDRMLAGAQNPAGDQLQDEAFSTVDDRVSRIVTARASRNVIERRGKVVHYLALAFIAPLRTYHDDRLHQPVSPNSTLQKIPRV